MITNKKLLELYLEDLTLPDITHGGRIKTRHPEYWNFPPVAEQLANIDLLDTSRDIWVWSDLHLNHKNIIQYSGRPFPTVDLMNKCLIGNYTKYVKPDDIVFWCGDITFGRIEEVNRILDELPGYKIHVVGNHDMDNHGKLNNIRMNETHPCYVLNVIDADLEYQLLITHYPITNIPPNCVSIHGHIHQHILDPWNINVSVEHTNYTPRNLRDIKKQASEYIKNHSRIGI